VEWLLIPEPDEVKGVFAEKRTRVPSHATTLILSLTFAMYMSRHLVCRCESRLLGILTSSESDHCKAINTPRLENKTGEVCCRTSPTYIGRTEAELVNRVLSIFLCNALLVYATRHGSLLRDIKGFSSSKDTISTQILFDSTEVASIPITMISAYKRHCL
jgi:hypothetical protein